MGRPHHAARQYGPEARYAVEREAELPTTKWDEEIARGLEFGLPGADSIVDKRIPDVLPGRAAPLRRHQHVPQGALPGGRAPLRRVRRGRARRTVRRRHHLPLRHPLRPAGHPEDLRALRPVLLRTRRRPARVDHDRRPRRHLHHPGQHREDVRPDLQGGRPRLRVRRVPGGARRRPLDRLSHGARRGPAPARATSASSTSTGTSTPRRPTSTSGCTPRRGSTPPTCPTCRRRTWSRSASAAGRRPAPA